MRIASKTDIGRTRRTNQDSYASGEITGGVAWAVVCDGMGGANGGNIASETAVKIVSDRITNTYRRGMSSNSIKSLLESAVNAANLSVFDMAKAVLSLSGMGTTLVAVVISDSIAHIVHAGDSRVYLISEKRAEQLTTDHSIVQAMLANGQITADEAKVHPKKNVITRALGVGETIDVDYREIILQEQDAVLLCTDGLTNYLDDENIIEVVGESGFYEYPEKLIERANENGGGDNITVVVISQ